MKCGDCKFVDIKNIMDKCPECGSDNWIGLTTNDLIINRRKLDSIFKESEGDYDFILSELKSYWKKQKKLYL